jgi:hypothetical protein
MAVKAASFLQPVEIGLKFSTTAGNGQLSFVRFCFFGKFAS